MKINNIHKKLRQIRIPPTTYQSIKRYCLRNGITMQQLYESVFDWFGRIRPELKISSFYACYKRGQLLSLWLPQYHIDLIQTLARQANVSDARVVYTALMLYLEKIN